MTIDKNPQLQDRPIQNEREDLLDRGPFIESLMHALIRDAYNPSGRLAGRTATGYVVGLVGRWGSGKSSILRILELKLQSMSDVAVVMFNPWLFEGRDELIRAFFKTMRESLGRSPGEKGKELVKALNSYWAAIDWTGKTAAAYADIHGGGGFFSKLWKWICAIQKSTADKLDDKSLESERKSLEAKLEKYKIAVVVLIDELDRVEDDDVRIVAQLIKALGDIKGISYLVAYDDMRVINALGRGKGDERMRSGAAYLEKIIQHPIPLRPLFDEDVDVLLKTTLNDHKVDLGDCEAGTSKAILDQLKKEIATPRDIKRLVGSFAVLEQAVRGEISPADVLAYCWIATKSPELRHALEQNIDKVVEDPSALEMVARISTNQGHNQQKPTVVQILGPSAATHETLLSLLFPRFGKSRAKREVDRISRRRNLVRLLYLGNPPGMIRRSEIEQLWSMSDPATLEKELMDLLDKNKLNVLIDRLEDLWPSLPVSGDKNFFTTFSRLLVRPQDWSHGPDPRLNIADDLSTCIYRCGTHEAAMLPRIKAVIEYLIEVHDLTIIPWLLRRNLFAHGLTHHSPELSREFLLSEGETKELLEREFPRYREAVSNGTVLRRIINTEVIYVIDNTEKWDESLRQTLSTQLVGIKALGTAATLFVPPGYTASREDLNQLFDADSVLARLNEFEGTDNWPQDIWVSDSLKRFRMILQGKDPTFVDIGGKS